MPSRCMPKKFSVTVPEPVYETLSMLARIKDKSVATLAAQAIEDAANEAVESGIIAEFQELTERGKDGRPDGVVALDILLTKLADGKQPTDNEISKAASYASVSEDGLKTLFGRINKETETNDG